MSMEASLSPNESTVAEVVRRWALGRRVAGSISGRVIVFAFLGNMLNLDCLSLPRCNKFDHIIEVIFQVRFIHIKLITVGSRKQ